MTGENTPVERILAALSDVDGLAPATPATVPQRVRVPWNVDSLAVDLDEEQVEVRLVAAKLPLPPLLAAARDAVRPVLDSAGYRAARLRFVVTDLDRAALADGRSTVE